MFKDQEKIKAELKELIAKGNAMLNASQNKQKITAYLYIIFSFFALSFFGFFAIGPTITTISNLNRQFEEDKVALQQLLEKNAALKALSAQYIEIQDELYLVDKAIPQSPKVAELTRQLETLANRRGLSVIKLDTGLMELYPSKNANEPIFSYAVNIAISGPEDSVNQFISDIIKMERIIGIQQLSTGRLLSNSYTATLTGKAYFYRE